MADDKFSNKKKAAAKKKAGKKKAVAKKKSAAKAKVKPQSTRKKPSDLAAPAKATSVSDPIKELIDQSNSIKTLQQAQHELSILDTTTSENQIKFGGVLYQVNEMALYSPDYDSFKEWCQAVAGMTVSKAMRLVRGFEGVVESGLSWEELQGLGWSRVSRIAPLLFVAPDVAAARDILKDIDGMTNYEVGEYVKDALRGDGAAPDPNKKNLKTFSVLMIGDQIENINAAVDLAKTQAATKDKAVALDHMATAFNTGSTPVPTMRQQMEASDPIAVLQIFEEVWPDVDVTLDEETLPQ